MFTSSRAQATAMALTALPLITCVLVQRSGRVTPSGPLRKELALQALGTQPLSFEANEGQIDRQVRFLSRGSGYTLFLTGDGAVLRLPGGKAEHRGKSGGRKAAPQPASVVRMQLQGANRAAQVRAEGEIATRSHYLLGNDSRNWRTGVRHYTRARYEQVYPGVDLVYYGNQRQLEYDFVVAPGADPRQIRLRFKGTERVEVSPQGDLLLHTAEGTLKQHRPVVYQEQGGRRTPVPGRYLLAKADSGAPATIGFEVPHYDPRLPLVIDPVLSYSSYVGGSGDDYGTGISVDGNGVAWIAGYTSSVSFPASGATTGAYGGGTDAFVARVSSTGALLSVTYLGGSGADRAHRICADSAGEAYLVGETSSDNFPTVNAYQSTFGGVIDAFLTKLSNSGAAISYSTYVGGQGDDRGNDVCVDGAGVAYITGLTTSTDYPTTAGAFKPTLQGTGSDAFVTGVGAAGNALLYSTYLGGTGDELANGIAVDTNGSVFVTGDTSSADFPTTAGAFQRTPGGGLYDVFLTRLNPGGASLAFSTFVGGNGVDRGAALALDGLGNSYLTGFTNSTSFPTVNAPQPVLGGGSGDAFVSMVNSTGTGMIYSTYLGGSNRDNGQSIVVEPDGTAAVVGLTDSTNFPRTSGGLLGGTDAFITRIAPGGVQLSYSASIGGAGSDLGLGVAADSAGGLYITGATDSANFSASTTYGGGEKDAFVVRLGSQPLLAPSNLQLTVVSSTQIDLSWTDNSNNEDSFTIERREGSGIFNVVGVAGANQTSFSDTGLSSLTTYTYRVRASSSDSTSAPSNEQTATTPAGLVAPSNLRATSVTRTQINLAWNDNSTGETGFRIERSTNGGLTYSTLATIGANVITYANTGLTGGTTYTYRVRATTAAGTSSASNELSASTLPDPPGAPVNLSATAGDTGVELVWEDGSFNETGFKIERATGAAGAFGQILTTNANVLTVMDTTTAPGTQYRYRVRATNTGGDSDYSNVATITTASATPSAPSGLTVTALSRTELKLTWDYAAADATTFQIERKTGAQAFALVNTVAGDQRTWTNTGLQANTTYTYRVRAHNAAGDSAYSAEVAATTLANPPATPTILTATPASRTSIVVSWIDRSVDETGFKIERKTGAGQFTLAGTAVANAVSFTDTGLTGETTYTYRVRATNSGGDSDPSAEASGTTRLNPPSDFTVTTVSSSQLRLNWTDNSGGETAYVIERASGGGSFAQVGHTDPNVTTYLDSGLAAQTTYQYRVSASDGLRLTEYAGPVSGTTLVSAPAAPHGLQAALQGARSVVLTWTDASNTETGVVIERKTGSGTFTQLQTVGAGTQTYTDSGLAAATAYTYRVKATNAGGDSAYTTEVSITTLPDAPVAPTGLTAVVMSVNQVRLSWTDSNGGSSQFRVSRRTGTGDMAVVGTVAAGVTLYLDSGLAAETDYTYSVKAFNPGGESAASNEATARIPTGGVLSVSTKVNFGSVKIGRPKVKTLKITNKGKGTLAGWVEAGGVTAPYRVIDGDGSFTLARKQSKLLRLEFNPTAKVTSTALLKITSTDPKKSSVNVTLTGKGK